MFEEDGADFLDHRRLALARMLAAHDVLRRDVVDMSAGVLDHTVAARRGLAISFQGNDGVGFDPGSHGDIRERQQVFVLGDMPSKLVGTRARTCDGSSSCSLSFRKSAEVSAMNSGSFMNLRAILRTNPLAR